MDFHSLARRDLQALCKKNKIPANLTNVAMADALQALQSIEWEEEIRQKLMPQSETMEQHGSPLPKSRRVSAISSNISSFPMTDEVEEMKKEALIEANQTPATAVRRSQRIQSSMSTRTRARTSAVAAGTGASAAGTRTRKSKQEEASAETIEAVVAATPAPQRGRKKALETPAPVPVARSSARPTRQSTRKPVESTRGKRVTKTMESLMALDADDGKEAHTEVNEVPQETEQAKEQAEDGDLAKEEQLVSDEKLNLVEHNVEQIESIEEVIAEESNIKAAIAVSEEKDEIPLENSTGTGESEISAEEEFASEITDQKKVPTENLMEEVADVGCDTDIAPISESGKVDTEKEEGRVDETILADSPIMGLVSEVVPESNADLQDAPPCDDITLDVQDAALCDTSLDLQDVPPCDITPDVQDAPHCDITFDAQEAPSHDITLDAQDALPCDITLDVDDAPPCDVAQDAQDVVSDLCFSSPVRAPNDVGVEKMLDSVVRRFAKASINSAKKTDATDKITTVEAADIAQNENAVKEKVDLQNMSLRKLKAMYKDRLTELNSKKVVAEEGQRLPLGKLDENLLV